MPKIAVVIPVYKQYSDLNFVEKVSLEQTFKVLANYDIFFVTHNEIISKLYYSNQPLELNVNTLFFDKYFFANIEGYNRLLLEQKFYKAFESYSHILICQLDVFVFSDQLDYFSKLNYDYIGGPWFEGYSTALRTSKIIGTGNGGFSLRKVSSFLRILDLFNLFRFLNYKGIKEAAVQPNSFLRIVKYCLLSKQKRYLSILPWQFPHNEDLYWSTYIRQFFPWFKVGNVEDSIAFSFEVNPDVLFKLNNQRLPMATHAWQKYNPEFWKYYIEKFGYHLEL
ncbi:DUF5672 family protein [Adhaeribacter radiodurans]|uniref:DUF5672 domain-containing protein n=1 Tax=Adhaeribacter radiodurans TaxID=2745197 RepID=A0A7L7L422_9BACT|nr:DUF5672 family protein [Adhaeribacter radiodurans]QMU27562.1 hypothetical protein HUW48_05685 [Adhaeribacter radiodurans]